MCNNILLLLLFLGILNCHWMDCYSLHLVRLNGFSCCYFFFLHKSTQPSTLNIIVFLPTSPHRFWNTFNQSIPCVYWPMTGQMQCIKMNKNLHFQMGKVKVATHAHSFLVPFLWSFYGWYKPKIGPKKKFKQKWYCICLWVRIWSQCILMSSKRWAFLVGHSTTESFMHV